ncbi:MAG: collagenase [Chloroflexi bacterium]|nr:collagenase [Chloroflexota bacterium]
MGATSLAFVGAVLVLASVLACGSSKTERLDEQWANLGVTEAEFVFLGDVTPSEQESIKRELRVAQVVFMERFGAVASDFTVYVSTDLDLLNERVAMEHGGSGLDSACNGTAVRTAVFLIIEECPDADDYGQILAHEYFHMLQSDAGTLMGMAQGGLRWTVEGSAVYAAALFNEAQGRRTLAALRQGKQLAWAAGLIKGARFAYDYGFLATDWLAERAGTEAILKYFRLGGHRAAFESAFGMSLAAFNSEFEAYRADVARPFEWRVAGTVLGGDGAFIEGVHVYAVVRIEGEAWGAGTGETGPKGGFEFPAPGSGYTIAIWLQCPRGEGMDEWVRAGEWGEDGFVVDEDGAEPFTDGERDRTDLVIELPETRESLIAKHCKQ